MSAIDYLDCLLSSSDHDCLWNTNLVKSGSTGKRLFGYFSKDIGIGGEFHYIHQSSYHDLMKVSFAGIEKAFKLKTEYIWYPSHIALIHTYDMFEVQENKYITEDDVVISSLKFINHSTDVSFRIKIEACQISDMRLCGETVQVKQFCSVANFVDSIDVVLKKGMPFTIDLGCTFCFEKEKPCGKLIDLETHKAQFGRFFDKIPLLQCSDKRLEKVYYYRWFLLRHNYANPGIGNLQYPVFFEGRYGHNIDQNKKENINEWEFSRAILPSAMLNLLDIRWHENIGNLKSLVNNFTAGYGHFDSSRYQNAKQLIPGCIRVADFEGHYFYHILPYAVWEVYKLDRDIDWLKQVAEVLWLDLKEWDCRPNGLPFMQYEDDSAMEVAPSSHYRKLTDPNRLDNDSEPEITNGYKTVQAIWSPSMGTFRTEVATFYGLNYQALSFIFKEINDNREIYCAQKCDTIAAAMKNAMWSEETGFYTELTEGEEKIDCVKQVGGIFSLLLLDPPNPIAFEKDMTASGGFLQTFGLSTVSKDSFGYFPNNTVDGLKEHTCLWNGPTWPFSTGISLSAIASYIKRLKTGSLQKKYAKLFSDVFKKYTKQHIFMTKDRLCLVEHYNCETGTPLSIQEDYNHSTFINIFIEDICGLSIGNDGSIQFHPIDIGVKFLKLEGVLIHNNEYCVEIHQGNATLYLNSKEISRAKCI